MICSTCRGSCIPEKVLDTQSAPPDARTASVELELQDTARTTRDSSIPWYELVALAFDSTVPEDGVVTVGIVLAANAAISAARMPLLTPVLEVVITLVDIVRTAAHLRRDVLDTIEYCVSISKCVVQACKRREMPRGVGEVADDLATDMRVVESIARRVASPTCRCWQLLGSKHDERTLVNLRRRLRTKLRLLVVTLEVAVPSRPTPLPAGGMGRVRGEAPVLPKTYIKRALDDAVILSLTDLQCQAPLYHCVWGMGGGGKSLLASSVACHKRTLSSFKGDVFWVTVGNSDDMKHQQLNLLRRLAQLLKRTPAGRLFQWPDDYRSVDDITDHLKRVSGSSRCLVVLDDVWHEKVTDTFAATGFHLLVTSRRRLFVSRRYAATFTEVLPMADEQALELLGNASHAAGPLPKHEAISVAEKCGRLPMALNMAGRLGSEDPLNPTCWRGVLDRLRDKFNMFKMEEVSENGGVLFPVIDLTFDMLPRRLKKQFRSMAVVAPGVPVSTRMLGNLWDTVEDDTETDIGVLVENSLLHETSGVYRLHDLTHEFVQLVNRMIPRNLPQAITRQAQFLAKPETLQAYVEDVDGINGGLYSLVKLWVTLKDVDPSGSAWKRMAHQMVKIPEAATDTAYMARAGDLLMIMGEYDYAEPLYRRAMEATKATLGEHHPDFAVRLDDLAGLLKKQGKYEDAEPLFRRAMEITEATLGERHPDYAVRFNNLAGLLEKRGKYADAEPLYRGAMEITEATLGKDHLQYAANMGNLARLLTTQGKYEDAEPLYRRAMEITETTLGGHHPDYCVGLINLAGLLKKQCKYEDAESLYRRAMKLTETALGKDHLDYATVLNNLAGLLDKQGKYEDAERLYRRAMGIMETTLGKDHPDFSVGLNNVAGMLYQEGKYEDAEPLYRRAMGIVEKALGKDHPNNFVWLNNLAGLLYRRGKYEDAEPLYRRAMEITEATLGKDHPDNSVALNNLAGLLHQQGKYEDAESLYRRAMEITEATLGNDHHQYPDCLMNLAGLLETQGKYEDAEPLYRRAMEITEATLGKNHPQYTIRLSNLAGLLETQGKYEDAELLYRRAMEIAGATLGEAHPDYYVKLNNLAWLLKRQGKYEDAEPLYRRAMDITEETLGKDHPYFAVGLNSLAGVLHQQGKDEDAEPLYRRAMEITEATRGNDHSDYYVCLINLTELLTKQGKYDDAEPLCRRAMDITEATLGEDHPRYSENMGDLARLMVKQGKYEDAESLYRRAMEITEATLGKDHPVFSIHLNNLAHFLFQQGKYEDAEPVYRRAIKITEATVGKDHPRFSASLMDLAGLQEKQGKDEDAESLYRHAIEITEATRGRDHPQFYMCLYHLAGLQDKQGQREREVPQELSGSEDVIGLRQVLESLSCREWLKCLTISKAVRRSVHECVVDPPRESEGWTVPLDILRVWRDEFGKCGLISSQYGVRVESTTNESDRHMKALNAVLVPPPASGSLVAGSQLFFAITPVLRCRWKGNPSLDSPWKVQFCIDEETSCSVELSDMKILHRSPDQHQGQWQQLRTEIVPLPSQAIEFEVLLASDIVVVVNGYTAHHDREGVLRQPKPCSS